MKSHGSITPVGFTRWQSISTANAGQQSTRVNGLKRSRQRCLPVPTTVHFPFAVVHNDRHRVVLCYEDVRQTTAIFTSNTTVLQAKDYRNRGVVFIHSVLVMLERGNSRDNVRKKRRRRSSLTTRTRFFPVLLVPQKVATICKRT